jgi:hypothetical protein
VAGNKIETVEIVDGPFSGVYTVSTDTSGTLDNGGSNGGNELIAGGAAAQTLNGGNQNDLLFGAGGIDALNGGSGNDLLVGGLDGAVDQLKGNSGDDHYIVDESGALDVVTENSGEGTDTVWSSVTYSLTNNVENLNLTGVGNINGTGNTSDNEINGNAGNNTLNGGDGSDTLRGLGGIDTLNGDAGTDLLYFENIGSTYNGGANSNNDLASSAGDVLDVSHLTNFDPDAGGTFTGIETIRMSDGGPGTTLTLDAADVISLGTGTFTGIVPGGGGGNDLPTADAIRVEGETGGTTANQDALVLQGGTAWNDVTALINNAPSGSTVYAFDGSANGTLNAASITAYVIVDNDVTVQFVP